MSAKHTPGPWFVAKEADVQASDGNVVISPNGYEIRPVPGVRLGDEMADLQLTAAAPELLQALQFAIRFHDQLTPSDVERMRKIVAKAIGSTT